MDNKIIIAISIIVVTIIGITISFTIQSETQSTEIINSKNTTVVEISDDSNKQIDDKSDEQVDKPEIIVQTSYNSIKELTPDEILNKKIPPNYELGNTFINLLQNGQIFSKIENENQKSSIRFTNQYEGFLEKIKLNIFVQKNSTGITGIQLDDGQGNPDGIWLNLHSEPLSISAGQKAREFFLPEPIFLEENKIYHIVLQHASSHESSGLEISEQNLEPILILNYRDNVGGYPFNPEDPDIYLPDPAINSLFFDGTTWQTLDRWPSFLLSYSDEHLEGQPYTLAAPWSVSDNTYVGQAIIPHSEYNVTEFSFVLGLDGEPSEPFYYGIQDNEGIILDTGIIATSDELSWTQTLATVELEEPIILDAGKLYRFYVYSTIPKPENKTDFYKIYGQEFSFDYGLTYGGLIHRLTISHDYGETWSAWLDADTIFILKTK